MSNKGCDAVAQLIELNVSEIFQFLHRILCILTGKLFIGKYLSIFLSVGSMNTKNHNFSKITALILVMGTPKCYFS